MSGDFVDDVVVFFKIFCFEFFFEHGDKIFCDKEFWVNIWKYHCHVGIVFFDDEDSIFGRVDNLEISFFEDFSCCDEVNADFEALDFILFYFFKTSVSREGSDGIFNEFSCEGALYFFDISACSSDIAIFIQSHKNRSFCHEELWVFDMDIADSWGFEVFKIKGDGLEDYINHGEIC